MRIKFIILTIMYFGFGISTFTSCGELLKYDATICDISFGGLNSDFATNSAQPDKFSGRIGFEIQSISKSPTCLLPTIQLFNSAYATSKCAVFQNQLLKSSYELSFDRPIILNGDTINSNTNLLAITNIAGNTDINLDEDCKFVTSTIVFRQELIDQIVFELGDYLVTFKCSTSDNKTFLKTRRVIFIE